jgi:hypothetical protein
LYCLEIECARAWFVEVPEGVVLQDAPFLFFAQYSNARRLISVTLAQLLALSEQPFLTKACLSFTFHTGRCGSTLLHHLVNQSGVSYSEPAVLRQLFALRGNGAQVDHLIAASARILFRQQLASKPEAALLSIKLNPLCNDFAGLLYATFPGCKFVFIHRGALGTLNSVSRIGLADPSQQHLSLYSKRFIADLRFRLGTELIKGLPLSVYRWVLSIEQVQEAQRLGLRFFSLSYEELCSSAHASLNRLLKFFELPGNLALQLADVSRILAQDSQRDTPAKQREESPMRQLEVSQEAANQTDTDFARSVEALVLSLSDGKLSMRPNLNGDS